MENKIISPDEQKKLLVDMLKYIDDICRKNDIKYSLIGGSLIGAIRHKGFIPWDDDIDIILDYSNYNKLLNVLEKKHDENYEIFIPLKKKGYSMPFAKLIYKKTSLQHAHCIDKVEGYGLYLDIFCYANIPNDYNLRKEFFKKLLHLNGFLARIKLNYNNPNFSLKAKRLIKNTIIKMVGYNYFLKKQIKHFTKYALEETDYVILNYPVYGLEKDQQKSEYIKEYIDATFEDITVMIFKNYDAILRNTFGDYMQLPPENERVAHHNIEVYWNN